MIIRSGLALIAACMLLTACGSEKQDSTLPEGKGPSPAGVSSQAQEEENKGGDPGITSGGSTGADDALSRGDSPAKQTSGDTQPVTVSASGESSIDTETPVITADPGDAEDSSAPESTSLGKQTDKKDTAAVPDSGNGGTAAKQTDKPAGTTSADAQQTGKSTAAGTTADRSLDEALELPVIPVS